MRINDIAKLFKIPKSIVVDVLVRRGDILGAILIADDCISHSSWASISESEQALLNLQFSHGDIFSKADTNIPFALDPTIYFLIDESVIVYIGKSNQLPYRVNTHIKSGKEFTKVAVYQVSRSSMSDTEVMNIYKYNPFYNKDVLNRETYFNLVIHNCFFDNF